MTPGVNPVNAYTSWESWIKNPAGNPEKVSRTLVYDEVGAFLWERPLKDESQGVVHYVHDGL
ncbi:MAG: hypothetical protein GYA47_12725, partial [Desulfovibrio sp.]|nr:hypothetical protein [Desulfovibrio sp.]